MTQFRRMEKQPVQTDIRMCSGLFVKHCVFEAGSYIPQHSHETEHLSVIAVGTVRAWQDGELLGDFTAPTGIVIKARSKHMFLALTEAAILCVHRVDDDGDVAIHDLHRPETVEG